MSLHPLESAGVWTAANAYGQARDGKSLGDGYTAVSNGLLVSTTRSVSSSEASKRVAQSVFAAGKTSATQSKAYGSIAGTTAVAAVDVGVQIQSRVSQGDYDQTDPDYYFNSSVSNAAIGGAAVKNGAAYVTSKSMGEGRLKSAAPMEQNK